MVLRIVFVCFSVLLFSSCQQEVEKKGNEIPPVTVFSKPLDWEKQIVYLTSVLSENKQPQWLYYRARAYFFTHQYHLAKLDLEELLENANEINEEYYALHAWVLIRLGMLNQAKEAVGLLQASTKNASEYLPMFFEYHLAFQQKNEAKRIFDRIVKEETKSETDFSQLGELLFSGDTLRASNWLSSKTNIDYQQDFVAKSYLNLAAAKASPIAFQGICLRLMKNYPRDAYYLNAWAKFLQRMRKVDMSEKVHLQAIQLMPENENFVFDLGKLYFDVRNYPEAIRYFSKISMNQPAYSSAQYYKALTLFFTGKRVEAVQMMDSLYAKNKVAPVWSKKFYQFVRARTDSTTVSSDSLSNLTQ